MPRKKQKTSLFMGELDKPIVRDFPARSLLHTNEEHEARLLKFHKDVAAERLRKLLLLAEHYGVQLDHHGALQLAFRLATDTVRGFQLVYDGPVARTVGLASTRCGRPRGSGELVPLTPDGRPKFPVSDHLLHIFMRTLVDAQHVLKMSAAEQVAEILDPKLKGPGRASQREAKAKTIMNRAARWATKTPTNTPGK